MSTETETLTDSSSAATAETASAVPAMRLGILFDESFPAYLANEAVCSHRLPDLRPRPLVYWRKHVARDMVHRKDTAALGFGRLFHVLALEGEDAMAARYIATPSDAPDDLRRHRNAKTKSPGTVASIEWWDAFDAKVAGREIVAQSDIDLAWRMVRAVRAKPAAVKLLSRGKPEVTFRHKLAHFAVQARVDWFDGEDAAGPLLINLKSIDSLDDFDYQYEKFAYYKADAFHRLVVAKLLDVEPMVPQCLNLVVEKQEPFEVSIRAPDAEALAIGAAEVMADLRLLDRCFETGVWPGEPDEARPVSLSEWKVKRATAA